MSWWYALLDMLTFSPRWMDPPPPPVTAPPGWYRDTQRGFGVRWWDGSEWTGWRHD